MLNKIRLYLTITLSVIILLVMLGLYLQSHDLKLIIGGIVIIGIVWFGYAINSLMIGGFDSASKNLDKKYQNDSRMFACPQCGQKTISASVKSHLGVAKTVSCPNCGAKLGVPLWSFFYTILIIFLLPIISLFFGLGYLFVALLIIPGAYLATAFHVRFVPLIIKR
jgi:predicted RNA-binding Zn-ribbon protein involved in translation (DUF1610 family)